MRALPLAMEDNGAPVLLVFQSPGVNEWKSGRPVSSTKSGSVGARLANAFKRVGKERRDFNITNIVQCFPGKRRAQPGLASRDLTPIASARRHCSHWLRQDIEATDYKRVVVFGSQARDAVLALGYTGNPRFHYLRHPSGGLSDAKIVAALG